MYPILVTISLIMVFGSSAIMSISGLISFFGNNSMIIIFMGIGIEVGKILSISHLYRSWQTTSFFVKVGYILIIFILTLLTSFEVLGFLSQSHQKSTSTNQIIRLKLETLNNEERILNKQINTIDNTLKGLPETYVTKRINERKRNNYSAKQNRLIDIMKRKTDLKNKLISLDDNSNFLSSIAFIIKVKESTIISLFIPFLVMILEPLSLGLTVAVNAAWLGYNKSPSISLNIKKGENEDTAEELRKLQKDHNLSTAQIAKITNRKKIKTCEEWIQGKIPTPLRAVSDVKTWVEKQKQQKNQKPTQLVSAN